MKKTIRSVVCVLLTLVMLAGMGSGVFADWDGYYDDVPETAWYYRPVSVMSDLNVFDGVSEHMFMPHQTLTRAMAVTILYRFCIIVPNAKGQLPNVSEVNHPFEDVTPGSYYEKPLTWAYEKGITNGVSATIFAPNAPVTREQFACMLIRFGQAYFPKQFGKYIGVGSFCPNDIDDCSSWAKWSFLRACECKIFRGDGNDYCHPRAPITRAEAAQTLLNFDEYAYLPLWSNTPDD